MPTPKLSPQEYQEAVDTWAAHGRSRAKAAKALSLRYETFHSRLKRALKQGYKPRVVAPPDEDVLVDGRVEAARAEVAYPHAGGERRYLLTCAQNNTHLNVPVWENLQALAAHYGAEIMVSRFVYDVSGYGRGNTKPGTEKDREDLWYAPEIVPHLCDRRVEIAPGLVWCGEINILPTAARPLSGFEAYTGRKSGVFPHVKLAMDSIPSGKHEPTKFNYTTGAVTVRNYIQKKAGQKADFHHAYGALLVEVDGDGDWFCRQINADSEGTIYDLDLRVQAGKVTRGHSVEAITWGDIHAVRVDPTVEATGWGPGGMIDVLRPRHQFLHDLLDFRARNHHERGNPHSMFERHVEGTGNVEEEVAATAAFLERARREWCQSVVVDSNHDNALRRWLREADYRQDPENALFFLEAQRECYRALARGDRDFHLVEWALRRAGAAAERFLREDESFIVCHDAGGGIECGMHGHLGPNGRRGAANAFARMGRKSNVGHSHTAGIVDGIYTAGTSSLLDLGYNAGPSSWSHSHVVTYPNGKRAIVTFWRGKWRA